MSGYGFPEGWYDPTTGLPYQLTFGWAASTGGNNEIHEINTLTSSTVTGQLPVLQLGIGDDSGSRLAAGGAAHVIVSPSLDGAQGSEDQPVTVTTTFPAGVTPGDPATGAGYTCTRTGQTLQCSYPATSYAAGASLPPISVPVTVASTPSSGLTITASASSIDANPTRETSTVAIVPFSAAASPATVEYGSPSTLSWDGLSPDATGTVSFDSGTTHLCTATLPATSCSTPANLTPNTYPVTAAYSGDSNYTSASDTTSFTVIKATPGISASASSPNTYGTNATLTIGGLPDDATGQVTFTDTHGATLCTVADVRTATNCQPDADLPAGSYADIAVHYTGDSHYGAAGTTTSLTVGKAATTVTAAVSQPSVQYGFGDTLTFGGLAPDATGTVAFTAGATLLCTADLDHGDTGCASPDDLHVARYDVTATYSGDGNYQGSSATTAFSVTKQPAQSGFTASVASPSTTYGTTNALSFAGLPAEATGSVTFEDGHGTTLCTVTDITAADTSCATDAALAAGDYAVTATYSGDGDHEGTTASAAFTVTKAGTALTATVGQPTVPYGIAETLAYGGLPPGASGTVTFQDAHGRTLCTAETAKAAGCQADAALTAGDYPVTASYSGDGNHHGSTATTSFTVIRALSGSFAATAAPTSTAYGTPVTLSYSGLPIGATGTVTFTAAGATVCTATLGTGAGCQPTAHLAPGRYDITATYSGDTDHEPATAGTTFTVTPADTHVRFASPTATRAVAGKRTVLIANDLPDGATGTVVFRSGGHVLCSVTLPTRRCTVIMPSGQHAIRTNYSGDANYAASTTRFTMQVEAATVHRPQRGARSPIAGSTGSTVEGSSGNRVIDSTRTADTGVPVRRLLWSGLLLLAAGATLLRAGRRRSPFWNVR